MAEPTNIKPPFETIQLNDMIIVADLSGTEIRQLREAGNIMPLETIIQRVQAEYPGRIIEIELEEENNNYIYELELVDDDSMVWAIEVDAATGRILQREQDD